MLASWCAVSALVTAVSCGGPQQSSQVLPPSFVAPALASVEPPPSPERAAPGETAPAELGPAQLDPVLLTGPETTLSSSRRHVASWLTERLPPGGELVDIEGRPLGIVHAAEAPRNLGPDCTSVPRPYRRLPASGPESRSSSRKWPSRPAAPRGRAPGHPARDEETPKSADDERLGWPADKALRGLYVRGATAAGPLFPGMLQRMVDRGMNVIILDTKDYDGPVTYPSKVPLAPRPTPRGGRRCAICATHHPIRAQLGVRVLCASAASKTSSWPRPSRA